MVICSESWLHVYMKRSPAIWLIFVSFSSVSALFLLYPLNLSMQMYSLSLNFAIVEPTFTFLILENP